jgi:acyl-CoA reductase-like NAD-dependent aldehyde dehydrogenase
MRVWTEEVFAPVLPIVMFSTEEEAIKLANETSFGLGSYVHTKDLERASRVASQLETGMLSINGTNYVCPFNVFGETKSSGKVNF